MAATAIALVGCNGATPSTSESGATTSPTANSTPAASGKRLRIGVSIPAADHGWTAGVKWWAEEAKKLHPEVDWELATAKTPADQIASIDTMMAKKLDGIVILATESAPLTPKAKEIHEKGVFIVNVDRGFLEPVADLFLEGDNVAFGRKSAEYVAKKMGGKGNLLILEGIPCTVNTDRVNAAKAVFAAYPNIHILDSQSGMWNFQKSFEVTQNLLVKHKQVDAIWAQDDDMALGAEKALKEAGRDKNIWMLGGAGMKDIVKRVKDGDAMFPADITYPPSMIAAGMHLAVSALQGGKLTEVKQFLPRHIKIDVDLVEPANAAQYYFPNSVY